MYMSDLPGGALILVLVWQQMAFYLWNSQFTKSTQKIGFVYTLTLIPILILLGATSSFFLIHLKEVNLVSLLFSSVLNFIIIYVFILFSLSFYFDIKEDSTVYSIYVSNLAYLKQRKFLYLKMTVVFMINLIIFKFLTIDYNLVASFVVSQIMGKYFLKPAA